MADNNCDYGASDNKNCKADWAFAIDGMLSSGCCTQSKDRGWLSPQELISCDKYNNGCGPSNSLFTIDYIKRNEGLVTNQFPI